MCVHFALLVYAYVVQQILQRSDIQHHTANLLFLICTITPFKYLFAMFFWTEYSRSGLYDQYLGIWIFSKVLESIITTMTICLFVCLAAGWSIFRRKLPVLSRLRLSSFVSTYLVLSIACVIWVAVVEKYRMNFILYYETDPGILMLVLLALCGIRFQLLCHSVNKKFCLEPIFLLRLRIVGSIYMWAQPVMMIFLRADSAGAYRGKTMEAWWSIVTFLCQVAFLMLYDPRIFKKTFPFHAFVSEMKVVTNTENNNGARGAFSSVSGGTAALRDEDGRVRALNTFDKIHLARLKDIAKAFETEMQLLNKSHSKFQDLMNQVAADTLVALGYDYDSAMSWGGIEQENRTARFFPDDDEDEYEDVAIRRNRTIGREDDPRTTSSDRPFRPLSKPQRELFREDDSMDDRNSTHFSTPKEARFRTFEDRQKFRDRNEGKDIKIDRNASMSALQRALDESTKKNKEDVSYKVDSEGAKSEIIGLRRDPNNYRSNNDSDDNRRTEQKKSTVAEDDDALGDKALSATKKKKPAAQNLHK